MSIHYVGWRPSPSRAWAAALCCLAAAGCSDESYSLGGEQPSALDRPLIGTCAAGATIEPIDRMEDGDGTIEMTAQRGGVWFSFNDLTGMQFPHWDDETFVMSELDPPLAGSHYAANSYGSGFSDWGAGIGFELYNQKPYDLSRYAGITFLARRAQEKASALRFGVTDSATAPRGGQCLQDEGCNDNFGSDLILGTTFRRYSFRWSELTQEGWGLPHPDSINTSEVYGVRFQTKPLEDFDFWIDDIALLCPPK